MLRTPAMLLAAAIFAAAIPAAHAARVVQTDLDGLVERSAMVVEGEVLAVDIDAGTIEPRTRVTLRIDRIYGGEVPGSHLTFDLPMGVMPDGTILDIAEAPRFMPGASYLVFYKRGDWRVTPIAGWDQGYFRVVTATVGEVFASASGHCVVGVGSGGFALGPRVARPAMMPGFGEPVKVTVGSAVQPDGTCLTVDAVRDGLRKQLTSRPLPAVEWRATPVGSILRHALQPDGAVFDEGLRATCDPAIASCAFGGNP